MSTVLLVGAFGQGNPGDEALCAAFVRGLAGHDVVVASADPAASGALHGVATIPNTALATARAVRRADTVVVGGGTVFKTLDRSTGRRPNALLRNAAALVAGARLSGTKVALVGVGAGELRGRTATTLARRLVRHADLVVLRDEESAAVLAAAGAPTPFWVGADPALALDAELSDPSGTTAPAITGVCAASASPNFNESLKFCDTDATTPALPATTPGITVALSHLAGDDHLLAGLADALAPLCDDHDVKLQPWQVGAGGRDAALAAALDARLGGRARVVDPPRDLADATARLAGDRLVVGLRFHALVAAARAGCRFVAIAHEPKLAGLSRRLGQVSVPARAAAPVLAAAMLGALGNEPPLPSAVQAEADRARHTLALMRLLVDDGELAEPAQLAGLPLSAGSGTW